MRRSLRNIGEALSRVPIFYKVIITNSLLVLIVILSLIGVAADDLAFALVLACGVTNALLVRAALSPAAQLRELLAMTLNENERERERMAAVLRDGAAQRLAALALAAGGNRAFSAEASALMEELYNTARLLEPPSLRLLGLKGALNWLAADVRERRAVALRVECNADACDVPYALALGLYRLIEDVVRDCEHGIINVDVVQGPAGVGCRVAAPCPLNRTQRFRLTERAALLHGHMRIERGERTVIRLFIPHQESRSDGGHDSRLAG